jgi:hypothetical protein
MFRASFWSFPFVATMFVLASLTTAGAGVFSHHNCPRCGTSGHGKLVERTIMVPTEITETRMKTCVIKRTDVREETYTVFKRVPETRTFTKETCYLEDEVKTKEITKKECHRVTNPVIETCAVKVPHTEMRTEMVMKEICTECGPACIEVPCTREVTVEHDEIRSKTTCVPDIAIETTKREISYCVKVPKTHKTTCEETVYKLVPIEKTRQVEVCVPEIIKKPFEVTVTKMVPRTVTCCEKCAHRLGHGH